MAVFLTYVPYRKDDQALFLAREPRSNRFQDIFPEIRTTPREKARLIDTSHARRHRFADGSRSCSDASRTSVGSRRKFPAPGRPPFWS